MLMSAEKNELLDRLRAYHLEAQDFVTKPFSIEEMLLLLKSKYAFLKQISKSESSRTAGQEAQEVGHFTLQPRLNLIAKLGQKLELTRMEYTLLDFMLRHPQEVLTPEVIIQHVWQDKLPSYEITGNNLRALVHKIRKKIEPNLNNCVYLVNHKQNGYIFFPAPEFD